MPGSFRPRGALRRRVFDGEAEMMEAVAAAIDESAPL
jgi:hypothetical protein